MFPTKDLRLPAPRILLVVAAPAEVDSICQPFTVASPTPWVLTPLSDRLDLIHCGVGKANAAGAVARFADPQRHKAVISLGIAGALPGTPSLNLGSVVVGRMSSFADEGISAPEGFRTMSDAGFPPKGTIPGEGMEADPGLVEQSAQWAEVVGAIATVSTCSGTDELAHEVVRRTGARAEAMEGAAAGLIAWRLQIPFAEIRVISNTTGNRARQQWDVPGALRRLRDIASLI